MIYDDFNLPLAKRISRRIEAVPKTKLPVSSIVKVIKLTFCNEVESIVDKLKKFKRKRNTEY